MSRAFGPGFPSSFHIPLKNTPEQRLKCAFSRFSTRSSPTDGQSLSLSRESATSQIIINRGTQWWGLEMTKKCDQSAAASISERKFSYGAACRISTSSHDHYPYFKHTTGRFHEKNFGLCLHRDEKIEAALAKITTWTHTRDDFFAHSVTRHAMHVLELRSNFHDSFLCWLWFASWDISQLTNSIIKKFQ